MEHRSSEFARYHRQMLLPGIGGAGQRRLAGAHALLVGCGALGCTIADQLARAGVGTLTIVDRDTVELTNLQRQILFDEEDAREGRPKAAAAAGRLGRVNSEITIRPVVADFSARNAERLVEDAAPRVSVVLDGTDNFQTRYLINDLCVKHGIPFVYGGAVATTGMSLTIVPGRTPCLRCLFEQPPPPGSTPTCDTAGVLGPITTTIGAVQAAAAIRLLAEGGEASGSMMTEIDLWVGTFRRLDVSRARRTGEDGSPECECCVQRRFEYLEGGAGSEPVVLCGRDAVQVSPAVSGAVAVDLAALAARLAPHGEFRATEHLLRGRLSAPAVELTVFADGRAIVKGTSDPAVARSVYARFVGG